MENRRWFPFNRLPHYESACSGILGVYDLNVIYCLVPIRVIIVPCVSVSCFMVRVFPSADTVM